MLASSSGWGTQVTADLNAFIAAEDEFNAARSAAHPMGMIKNVQPGQRVRIIVQAVNGPGRCIRNGPSFL